MELFAVKQIPGSMWLKICIPLSNTVTNLFFRLDNIIWSSLCYLHLLTESIHNSN